MSVRADYKERAAAWTRRDREEQEERAHELARSWFTPEFLEWQEEAEREARKDQPAEELWQKHLLDEYGVRPGEPIPPERDRGPGRSRL